MAVTTAGPRLGTSAFDQSAPVELRPSASKDEIEFVIRAVYRQLLGNDYLMAAERLTSAESLLRDRKLTVQEFVRQVAKSELYKTKFFYNSFQTRTIELHTKHLLGRAPYDESEVIFHLDLYQSKGYDADIDSYIDSPEYQLHFGENIVPYYRDFETRGTGAGQRTAGFTRLFKLYRGYATSDRSQFQGTFPRLAVELAGNTTSAIPSPGSNYIAAKKGEAPVSSFGGSQALAGRLYRIEIAAANLPRYPKVRRINRSVIVPYEQLSPYLQQVNKQGGRIASVTPL